MEKIKGHVTRGGWIFFFVFMIMGVFVSRFMAVLIGNGVDGDFVLTFLFLLIFIVLASGILTSSREEDRREKLKQYAWSKIKNQIQIPEEYMEDYKTSRPIVNYTHFLGNWKLFEFKFYNKKYPWKCMMQDVHINMETEEVVLEDAIDVM